MQCILLKSFLRFNPFYSSFTEAAEKDYEMFEKQRDEDITNIMVKHVKSQIKLCKLVSSSLIILQQYRIGEYPLGNSGIFLSKNSSKNISITIIPYTSLKRKSFNNTLPFTGNFQ